jgi:hypothetical protein
MSYEHAMGTEDAPAVITATVMDEPAPVSEEEASRIAAEREAERDRELSQMWQTGRWREGPLFGRWLLERMRGDSLCQMMLMRFPCAGLSHWLASGHCALFVPTGQPCAALVPHKRWVALATFAWPILTSYWAWRKTGGCWGWTAAGAVAGFGTIPILGFGLMLLSGASFRY